jgi:Tfp pilus assembly protein PilF
MPAQGLYLDNAFSNNVSAAIETEHDVFQLDDDILTTIRRKTNTRQTTYQKSQIILAHLFDEESIAISYDSHANLTATQTYQSQSANCMSLTILAYSLAVATNLVVKVQAVEVPEYWTRDNNFSVLTGHVNLLIKSQPIVNKSIFWGNRNTVIDFDPFIAKKNFPAKVITKKTLLAMFYNNKGAQALINQDYNRAYEYFKGATLADPTFVVAWGNLGVLYKVTGFEYMAEAVYVKAIGIDSDNLTVINNLARLLTKQGRTVEALPLKQHVDSIRKKNPFYLALLANEAMFNKQYQTAINRYRQAIKLDKKQHQFYFGLALAYYQHNNVLLSRQAMEKALALSSTNLHSQQYTAKLNLLAQEAQGY